MLKPDDFEFAMDQTLQAYPSPLFIIKAEMINQIENGIQINKFTSKNGARARILDMTEDDLLKYFIDEGIKAYNAASYFYFQDRKMISLPTINEKMQYLLQAFPYFGDLQKLIAIFGNQNINCSLHLKSNHNDLYALVNAVIEMRFHPNNTYRSYIDQYGNVQTVLKDGKMVDLFTKTSEDVKRASIAKTVQVNYRTINRCMEDLMTGTQLKNQRNEYALEGTLFATQDIGRKRPNQEDSVIILTHPENPDFKLLAVSDGMGGVELGEKASLYTLQEITKWFQSLPKDLYYYPGQILTILNSKISEISNEIYRSYNADFKGLRAGATFVGAIVANEYTILSSVGDSRAYRTFGNNMELITQDESLVWPPKYTASQLNPEFIDDMRFNKQNNAIRRCIGMEMIDSPQSYYIPNTEYNRLILMTDGVTDLLTQEKIKVISLNMPPAELTRTLVNEAVNNMAIRLQGGDEFYNASIAAGKDNATAAAYIRR